MLLHFQGTQNSSAIAYFWTTQDEWCQSPWTAIPGSSEKQYISWPLFPLSLSFRLIPITELQSYRDLSSYMYMHAHSLHEKSMCLVYNGYSFQQGAQGHGQAAFSPLQGGDSSAFAKPVPVPLHILCQCSSTFKVKKRFLVFRWNLLCCNFCPLPLALDTTMKTLF